MPPKTFKFICQICQKEFDGHYSATELHYALDHKTQWEELSNKLMLAEKELKELQDKYPEIVIKTTALIDWRKYIETEEVEA